MTTKLTPFTSDAMLIAAAQVAGQVIGAQPSRMKELPTLLAQAYKGVESFATSMQAAVPAAGRKAAVSIEDSVQPGYLVCLEDGKKLKMLKRYLRTHYSLTPEQYRQRWSLPATYPMVAPEYATRRSQLAKHIGLGHVGKPASRKERMAQAASVRRAA